MHTMISAQKAGTYGPSDRGTTAYESNQGGLINNLGLQGKNINRVITRPLNEIVDEKMRQSVAKELLRPQLAAAMALAAKSGSPAKIEVIITQYPRELPDLNLNSLPK